MPGPLELYGTRSCPYTAELREQLEWDGREFADYDVEADAAAFARVASLTGGTQVTVPVLVEDGRVVQIGWQGRGCMAQAPAASATPGPSAALPGPVTPESPGAPAATAAPGAPVTAAAPASPATPADIGGDT